jgi:hypothetical protein
MELKTKKKTSTKTSQMLFNFFHELFFIIKKKLFDS